MCKFKSFIVTKTGDVLFSYMEDSHEAIISENKNKYDLLDETSDPKRLKFARVEIVPPNDDIFEHNLTKWILNIDQAITPTWWSNELEKKCFDVLEKYLKGVLYENKTLKVLKNISGIYLKNTTVNTITNCIIKRLEGSSQVGEMWGNSQVGKMCGNSQVGEMCDSSQVGKMCDSSRVGKMCGNSQVGEMCDSSQVGKMCDSSQVGKMCDSSQVGKMWCSSQVGEMWGSSQVGETWGNSQVGEMCDSSQVGKMWGNSQVGKMCDSSQVGKMWGNSLINIYSDIVKFKISDNGIAILRYTQTPIIMTANSDIKIKKNQAEGE